MGAGKRTAHALVALGAGAVLLGSLLACAGCGPSASGADAGGQVAETPLAPPEVEPVTVVSLEPAGDEVASLVMAARFQNPNDQPSAVAYGGAFVVQDASGSAVRVVRVGGRAPLAAGGERAVDAKAEVDRSQVDALGGAWFACGYVGEGGLRLFLQGEACPIDSARQAFLEEEARRAEEAKLAAWRARFPLDDYSNTLLIGDSIMQNASSSLKSELLGVTVDADAGRTLEAGGAVFENGSPDKGVLDHVRADRGSFDRYVIGTGNNDPGGLTLEAAEEIIACLGDGKEIYFVTMATRNGSNSMRATNATIADVVARYPNVHVVDWHAMVAGHEAEYLRDFCHPYRNREPDYARCMREALETPYPR